MFVCCAPHPSTLWLLLGCRLWFFIPEMGRTWGHTLACPAWLVGVEPVMGVGAERGWSLRLGPLLDGLPVLLRPKAEQTGEGLVGTAES